LSDSSGNIAHQGNLISNINGTSLLSSTFPTSSTGNSTAHAHYTDISTNALKFLNASGNKKGGHEFWISTSSSAPSKTATIDISGLTINKPSLSPVSLLNLPNVSNSIDIAVNFPSPLNVAPYNMTPVNSIFPVQVNSNCTNMSTGIIYYAKVFSATTLQLNTNPDGGVPTIINTADLASRPQPILSLVQGSVPINQIVNLNEKLSIIKDTDESILSATDLTFNSVSLPSKVSQNTLDISQNRTDISRNTLNIAQNTLDISQNRTDISQNKIDISLNTNNINTLTIKQTNTIYQFSSPAIYADGSPPLATPTSIINSYAINAWYFKNLIAGQKINWYMPTTSGLKVQDILGLYLRLFNVSTTSNDNSLFLTVYTTPDAGPNYSWYKSRMVYVITATPTINTLYTFFANASGSCPSPSNYASTTLQMTPSTVSNPRGTYGPTENIMFFSIGSNSASAVNSVEVVVQKFGVMTPTGTQEFQFAPLL
jgi:hypothetical protein